MKKTGSGLGLAIVLLVWCGGMLLSGVSSATLDIQKKAKAAGIDASNCLYCQGSRSGVVEGLPGRQEVTRFKTEGI